MTAIIVFIGMPPLAMRLIAGNPDQFRINAVSALDRIKNGFVFCAEKNVAKQPPCVIVINLNKGFFQAGPIAQFYAFETIAGEYAYGFRLIIRIEQKKISASIFTPFANRCVSIKNLVRGIQSNVYINSSLLKNASCTVS
ncbi:hypothetical protein D3OALGA1CA_3528 [Olavius algarvensis associated proteobacterium Delta 3]|nr:hypothetical protein D3OALGA1CA_3528 [Olavius algarvensis associated proteobacterium Delta 3]